MPGMIRLLVCSGNQGKAREIRQILGAPFEVVDLAALAEKIAVEETGTSFEENAALKAVAGSLAFDGWVVADDSGLEVDALGGQPGVHSARYAGPDATDSRNVQKLLQALEGIAAPDRTARFRCVMVIARAGRKEAAFEGTVKGRIALVPSGSEGFGYDPVFIPEGYTLTFAQMLPAIKNRISHRARALEKLAVWGGWL